MNKANPFAGACAKADNQPEVKTSRTITVTLEIPYGVEFIVGCGMAYDGNPDLIGAVVLKQLTSNEDKEQR